jgi:type I restriction enzyme M protein
MLCVTNMILHGIDTPSTIRHDNTLSRPYEGLRATRTGSTSSSPIPLLAAWRRTASKTTFPPAFRTRETADLFMALIIKLLKKNRAGPPSCCPTAFLFRRRHEDPAQGKPAGRVQSAHHRPPAQRRVQPLHRHQDQPAFFHQRPSPPNRSGTTSTPIPKASKATTKPSPCALRSSSPKSTGGAARPTASPAGRRTNRPGRSSIDDIKARNYNLDIKNPHVAEQTNHDPDEAAEKICPAAAGNHQPPRTSSNPSSGRGPEQWGRGLR